MSRTNQVKMNDVGVLLIGFNRPELLRKRIEEVYSQNVTNLYISIDGGANSHTKEMRQFKQYAKLARPKTCNLHLTHYKNSLGIAQHCTTAISNVLLKHKFIIVIEDDIKLSKNFVHNLIQGLDVLNSANSPGIVCSFSPLNYQANVNYWRKLTVPYLYVWGWACSREVWRTYKLDISKIDIVRELEKSQRWQKLSKLQKNNWIRKFHRVKIDSNFTWDYQFLFSAVVKNYTVLGPLFSFSGNEGFHDERATHTRGAPPRYLNNSRLNNSLITKQISFPVLKYLDKSISGDNYTVFGKSFARIKSKSKAVLRVLNHIKLAP